MIQHWVVLNPDGSINCQPKIDGPAAPSIVGDNPDGLREIMVDRHGDLTHEHFDAARGRWVSDRAKKRRLARRAHLRTLERDELADMIAEEIKTEMKAEFEALAARVAALEAAGAKQ